MLSDIHIQNARFFNLAEGKRYLPVGEGVRTQDGVAIDQ